ncbi:type II toxin-antitoxin system Phd/YefM family antitoxin [Sandaracinobacteroides hominis]|uniref:type II toxin-antitoxin system Phd/YefM family antitoxin n=1 Tax=Sandaracinobacteroides hominis TaxID=2780086 RepID=UPI0018F75AF7|nr:type II toxin-antitoxin system Phd/YefM family antitoxin [Sandaracinobacteroides hominis]
MSGVNVHDAKTHFSRLLARVAEGESVVISKAGKPVARLVPIDPRAAAPRRIGFLKGQIRVPDDFDRMGAAEIEQLFGTKP